MAMVGFLQAQNCTNLPRLMGVIRKRATVIFHPFTQRMPYSTVWATVRHR
jgi:hypothetical protein